MEQWTWTKENGISTLYVKSILFPYLIHTLRFAYVDVAFASVLRKQNREQRHLHTYDIGCKYGIHFKERVTQSVLESETAEDSMSRDVLISPSDFPPDFSIKVPSWHVLGHILPCVLANNLRYTPLVGRTAGEGVETIWAVMNAHQYSTREMTHGHRRDCLTDIFNDYNWLKLCSESKLRFHILESLPPSLSIRQRCLV